MIRDIHIGQPVMREVFTATVSGPPSSESVASHTLTFLEKPKGVEGELKALTMTPLRNEPDSRAEQRTRVKRLWEELPKTDQKAAVHQRFLARQLELAEKFDLLILDSGNLYHGAELLWALRSSKDGETLYANCGRDKTRRVAIARDPRSEAPKTRSPRLARSFLDWSHEVYLKSGGTAFFHYNANFKSAAVYVSATQRGSKRTATAMELADSLSGLDALPRDYLSRVSFVRPGDLERLKIPLPQDAFVDLRDNANIDPGKKHASPLVLLASYSFTVCGRRITLQIPRPQDGVTKRRVKRGYFVPAEKDLKKILAIVLRLTPKVLWADELVLSFLPYDLGEFLAYTKWPANHIVFSGAANACGFGKWLRNVVVASLHHELGHLFHMYSEPISALLYRCLLLDGWTTEYGSTDIYEYFAVLVENYFYAPQNRFKFPNGYRLVHTLIALREAGVHWQGGEDAAPELWRLNRGGDVDSRAPARKLGC